MSKMKKNTRRKNTRRKNTIRRSSRVKTRKRGKRELTKRKCKRKHIKGGSPTKKESWSNADGSISSHPEAPIAEGYIEPTLWQRFLDYWVPDFMPIFHPNDD